MENQQNIFISDNLKNFIEKLYVIYENNTQFKIKYIDFKLYSELLFFIENIKNFLIIENYNSFKNNIILIMCSKESIGIKNKNLSTYLTTAYYGIYNDIIGEIIIEINKNFSEKKSLECHKEIISIIEKYFKNKKNVNIYDDLKKILKKNNNESDLFYKFFNNIEFDEKIFKNDYTMIDNITDTSVFGLKKKNGKIILLEIFNNSNIKIIISEDKYNKYIKMEDKRKSIITDNSEILKIIDKMVEDIDDNFDIEIINNKICIKGYKKDYINYKIVGGNKIIVGIVVLSAIKILILDIMKPMIKNIINIVFSSIFLFSGIMLRVMISNRTNFIDGILKAIIKINDIFLKKSINNSLLLEYLTIIFNNTLSIVTGLFIISSIYLFYPLIIKLIKIIYNSIKNIFNYCYSILKKNIMDGGNNLLNNNFYIIINLKDNIKNRLFSYDLLLNNYDALLKNKKQYTVENIQPYVIELVNKFECLTKTNLLKKK
jgi:hypothetical protein